MTEYPAHLAVERRLADGRRVTIRPIRAHDEVREHEFLDHLSGDTRRRRFIKYAAGVNGGLAHFYTHIDYDQHMAFVCEAEGDLVGDARYLANPDRRSCEFGIVVAEDWQHSGIAHLLMDALMRESRKRGLQTMEGFVLSDNAAMLSFSRALGFEAQPVEEQPTLLRVVKRL